MTLTAVSDPQSCPSQSMAPGFYPAQRQAIGQWPLVLLHGWGCDSRVWRDFAAVLNQHLNVLIIDLPGFGQNQHLSLDYTELLQYLPDRAFYLGWSLGGMVATQLAAHHPERVAGLITLAANAQFIASERYPTAMSPEAFDAFEQGINANTAATLKRFCLLSGNGLARAELNHLRGDYQSATADHRSEQYQRGLSWLASINNESALKHLTVPSLHGFADHDQLVPSQAAHTIGQWLSNAPVPGEVELIDGCHALFLSQPAVIVERIEQFVRAHQPLRDKRKVADSFSRAATTYDEAGVVQQQVGLRLMQLFGEQFIAGQAQWVLDLGAGTGAFSQQLKQWPNIETVLCADLAEGMLVRAKNQASGDAYVVADAEQMPLATAAFDGIFSSLAIQWCENTGALMAELKRLLKPGKKAMLATLGPGSMAELKTAWQAVDNDRHVNEFTPVAVLSQQARQLGFSQIEHHSETLTQHFSTLKALLHSIKGVGAHNVNQGQSRGLASKTKLQRFYQAYEQLRSEKGYPLTYCVDYLLLTNDET